MSDAGVLGAEVEGLAAEFTVDGVDGFHQFRIFGAFGFGNQKIFLRRVGTFNFYQHDAGTFIVKFGAIDVLKAFNHGFGKFGGVTGGFFQADQP